MIILILSEDPAQGLTISNEIHALLESLKIGVCRTGDLEAREQTSEEHEACLSTLRGLDVELELQVMSKLAKNPA